MKRCIALASFMALSVPWLGSAESILDSLRATMPSALEGLELSPEASAFPLHFVLRYQRYRAAEELIRITTDFDARDSEGETALTIAARDSSADAYDMVSVLLLAGADPNLRNAEGLTPLHYAARAGTLAVVELLVDRHGAEVNAAKTPLDGEPDDTDTPIVWAALEGNTRVVAFLERRGARAPESAELRMKIQMAQTVHYERLIDNRIDPSMGPSEQAKAQAVCRVEARAMALVDVGAPPLVVAAEWRRHQLMQQLSADPSMQEASSLDLFFEATRAAIHEWRRSGKGYATILDFNRQVLGR